MSNEALNRIQQTHTQFKKITADLNKLLGISFGYMKVFKDNSYYTIMDDLDCLAQFVTHVNKSSIFCERNVTNCSDDYNFTLWPKEPNCTAMDIYHQYGICNGITVSKISRNHTELYFFTQKEVEDGWHKFFIRNKHLLLRLIKYFDSFKAMLHLPENNSEQGLFQFNDGFDINVPRSEYIEQDSSNIIKIMEIIHSNPTLTNHLRVRAKLSSREIEVLEVIGRGYTVKIVAQKLMISPNTVRYHLEHIKEKTGLHYKMDLVKLYQELSD